MKCVQPNTEDKRILTKKYLRYMTRMGTDVIPRTLLDSVLTGEIGSYKKCVLGMTAVLSPVDGGNDSDIDY